MQTIVCLPGNKIAKGRGHRDITISVVDKKGDRTGVNSAGWATASFAAESVRASAPLPLWRTASSTGAPPSSRQVITMSSFAPTAHLSTLPPLCPPPPTLHVRSCGQSPDDAMDSLTPVTLVVQRERERANGPGRQADRQASRQTRRDTKVHMYVQCSGHVWAAGAAGSLGLGLEHRASHYLGPPCSGLAAGLQRV